MSGNPVVRSRRLIAPHGDSDFRPPDIRNDLRKNEYSLDRPTTSLSAAVECAASEPCYAGPHWESHVEETDTTRLRVPDIT